MANQATAYIKRPGLVPCLLGLLVVLALGSATYAHFAVLDGLGGILLPALFPDTTEYSDGYRDDAFRDLRIGSSSATATLLLGPPLEIDVCAGQEHWRYTRSRADSHYRVRQLDLENDVVVAKVSFYYVD